MSMPLQASNGPVGQPVMKQEPKCQATEAPQEAPSVRCFAPAEDADGCEAVITTLSQALAKEGMVLYITKGNSDAAQLFWQELLRARFKASPQARQVYCLSDFSAAALVHNYPQDRPTRWDLLKHGAVLKLASAVPVGKWKALMGCVLDLERQKMAFLKSQSQGFWYIELAAVEEPKQRQGRGSRLLRHICSEADAADRCLYAEASSEGARRWYARHGFMDVMSYKLRPRAPTLVIMSRPPRVPRQLQKQQQQEAGHGAVRARRQQQYAAAAAAAQQQLWSLGQEQQPPPVAQRW